MGNRLRFRRPQLEMMPEPCESMTQDPSEEELICQAQMGSSDCFGILAERYRPALLRYLCRRLGPTDAEDVLQETLMRAMVHIGSFNRGGSFVAWLMAIAANQAISFHRKRKDTPVEHVEPPESTSHLDAAGDVQRAIDSAAMWDAAGRLLKPDQHRAIQLRFAEGLGIAEVAGRMHKTQLHVRVLLFRARRKLLSSPRFVALLEDTTAPVRQAQGKEPVRQGKRGQP